MDLVYKYRERGYSTDYLFDFSIATDIKNSSFRTIYFDQGQLGMSREYLIKGKKTQNKVKTTFNLRPNQFSLFGCFRETRLHAVTSFYYFFFSGLEDEDVGHYYSYMQKVSQNI